MKLLLSKALTLCSYFALAQEKHKVLFDSRVHCLPDPFARGVYTNCKMETQKICMPPENDPFLRQTAIEHAIHLELSCESLDPRFEFEITHNEVPLQSLRPNKYITYKQLVYPTSTNCYYVTLVSNGPVKTCSLLLKDHKNGFNSLNTFEKDLLRQKAQGRIRTLNAYNKLEQTLIEYKVFSSLDRKDNSFSKQEISLGSHDITPYDGTSDLSALDFEKILEFSDAMYGKEASFADLQSHPVKRVTLDDVFEALLNLKELLYEQESIQNINPRLLKSDVNTEDFQ